MRTVKTGRPMKQKILIVERPITGNPAILSDPDAKLSAETLNSHPGFVYLLEKLRHQRGYFKSLLETQAISELRELAMLQAAVYWSGWLEQEVTKTLPSLRAAQTPRTPEPDVNNLFENARTALSEVGVNTE